MTEISVELEIKIAVAELEKQQPHRTEPRTITGWKQTEIVLLVIGTGRAAAELE